MENVPKSCDFGNEKNKKEKTEMFKLWIWTTVMFVFPSLVGGIVYAMTGKFKFAALAALGASSTLFLAASVHAALADVPTTTRSAAFVALVALTAVTIIFVLADMPKSVPGSVFFSIVAAVINTALLLAFCLAFFILSFATKAAIETARDAGAKEPFWALWLTLLPGVGTVWGIGFFSTRFLLGLIRRQNREISA